MVWPLKTQLIGFYKKRTVVVNMDFVMIWVDGSDPKWQEQKSLYSGKPAGDSAARFRDWGLLKYWFRSVEKFTPWVDKVHFVTCGHYPEWLNLNSPKLNFVKHSDYIPEEYLPTFNSHTIELNLHRIKGLAEEFVYFNDDVFIIDDMAPTDFFRKGLPCEEVLMQFLVFKNFSQPKSIDNYNMSIINRNFSKRKVIKNNLLKFFNPAYGLYGNLYSLYTLPAPLFTGFKHTHTAQSFLKSTFEEVWTKEHDFLDFTSKCKFRDFDNVNQYLLHHWQIVQGKIVPTNFKKNRARYDLDIMDSKTVSELIRKKTKKIICINDNENLLEPFEVIKEQFISDFEYLLPEKSSFEK